MENDNCVYARSILGRLNEILESSGSHSVFEDAQTNSADTSKHFSYHSLGTGIKINPGMIIIVVAMLIIGLMSLKNKKQPNPSKHEN